MAGTTQRGSRKRIGDERGFTLVEILVVMLVLALLAALAMPAFFSQRDKAKDADAKVEGRTAVHAIEQYATDNDGRYTGVTVADLIEIEPVLADATVEIGAVAPTNYTVSVVSATGTRFTAERTADGDSILSCDAPGEAGCTASGTW